MSIDHWWRTFKQIGAIWEHDPDPQRGPYALLTTPAPDGRRRMTNRYFNGRVAQAHAGTFGQACEDLAKLGKPYCFCGPYNMVYAIGAAEGGIALSQRIAEALHMRSAYAVKVGDRLAFTSCPIEYPTACLLVEDTVTTGGTLLKLQTAALEACEGKCVFAPQILAFCRRLGPYQLLTDRRIITLIDMEVTEWADGENPFTGGPELVEPVPGKTHWRELMRTYD
ncbi:MAG: hypothetical protein Q7S95_00510 [bacterium]|nr:hypothetical protein [bacterium]